MTAAAEAHLLSPYRPPTSYPVSLGADEASAWLAGWFQLWHPLVLVRLCRPPQISTSYDHDLPGQGFIYAVPAGPHLYQPDDWPHRVLQAQGLQFPTDPDRQATADLFRQACSQADWPTTSLERPATDWLPFAGIGYGFLIVDTLYEAADHERLLDGEQFWAQVQQAAQAFLNQEPCEDFLRAAALSLQEARERLAMTGFTQMEWLRLPDNPDRQSMPFVWPPPLQPLTTGEPITLLATSAAMRQLRDLDPDRWAHLRALAPAGLPPTLEWALSGAQERDDALLPPESVLWNLVRGQQDAQSLGWTAPLSLFGRPRVGAFPSWPSWLRHAGFSQAILANFDGAVLPWKNQSILNWPAPDGRSIDAIARTPHPADDSLTFFNLVYELHQASTNDSYPLWILEHRGQAPAVGYEAWMALNALGPVLGPRRSVTEYLTEHPYGDYLGATTVDDYAEDTLDLRVTTKPRPDPVSGFARHARLRRRLEAGWVLSALHRSLTAPEPLDLAYQDALEQAETYLETRAADQPALPADWPQLEGALAQRLTQRLQRQSAPASPGRLVYNVCSTTRRVGLEFPGEPGPIPLGHAVKASDFTDQVARVTVEIPPLGFAWIPQGSPKTILPKLRYKTAEGLLIRNEFFEAEIDRTTGGLRAFRDLRTRINRLGMMPIYAPGSSAVATKIAITQANAALAEITAQGELRSDAGQILARFTHRLRAWQGRPALEMRLDFDLLELPTGYPWYSFYGARFGRREERAAVYRGDHGRNARTTSQRPVTPDYLEFRYGTERTFVFSGGLPFFQTHQQKLIDAILIPAGETERTFEFLIAADRDHPMQIAQGWITPTPVVPTELAPPAGLTSSWLMHVDWPSLWMTGLRPVGRSNATLTARFLETAGFAGHAEIRTARAPEKPYKVDALGQTLEPLSLAEGAITVDFAADELFAIQWDATV